jgi:2-oxoglutarate ferredoxin oxidoreductase subunit alpha
MSTDIALGIAGSGGDGVILLGELLAKAAANVGLHTLLTKSFGPQIRGGESSSRIRVSDKPLTWGGEKIDALMLFHWADFIRFRSELTLKQHCQVFIDSADKTPEEEIPLPEHFKPGIQRIPFEEIALEAVKTKLAKNMVLAGTACELFNWPYEGIADYVKRRFAKQGPEIIESNMRAVEAGREYIRKQQPGGNGLRIEYEPGAPRIFISGNDAFAYGCLAAGCRFMAGYPITPASEILEWMSRELPRFGGVCIQAEDEISAVCMTIGASFAGVKAMTTTSGPGLSLKQEGIGLAVIAELPIVVCDVQRGGPSTGLPTRTEQSDLNAAVYGGHGDCPRVVLAATNIDECYELAHTAFEIAELYQTPVIVLLDQYLGHSFQSLTDINIRHTDPERDRKWVKAQFHPELWNEAQDGPIGAFLSGEAHEPLRRYAAPEQLSNGYVRYALTNDGVSSITEPGMRGGEYMAVGIEHVVSGMPSSSHIIHQAQSEKRYRKFEGIAAKYKLFDSSGVEEPKLGLLTWGSTFGMCEEICDILNNAGLPTAVLAPKILYPLPYKEMQDWLNGLEQLVTVETNYADQFYHYMKAFLDLPARSHHYSRAGGVPMGLIEVLNFILYNISLPGGFNREVVEERLNW